MDPNTQKMLAGQPYLSNHPELVAWQRQGHHLTFLYNQTDPH